MSELTLIRGYRVWGVDPSGHLMSTAWTHTWHSPAVQAECKYKGWDEEGQSRLHEEGQCPHPACSCGYYAHKEMRAALYDLDTWTNPLVDYWPTYPIYAIGTCVLWGKVIEHEMGWRAEWAEPESLYVPGGTIALLDAIHEKYPEVVLLTAMPEPESDLTTLPGLW